MLGLFSHYVYSQDYINYVTVLLPLGKFFPFIREQWKLCGFLVGWMTVDNPSEAGRKSSFEDLQYKNKHIIASRDKKPYTTEMKSSHWQYCTKHTDTFLLLSFYVPFSKDMQYMSHFKTANNSLTLIKKAEECSPYPLPYVIKNRKPLLKALLCL